MLATAMLLFLYWGGSNPYGPKRIMSTVMLPFIVLGGQWFVRRYFQPNGPGLGRALLTGLLIAVLASSVSALGLYAFARTASPTLLERNGEELRTILQAGKGYYLKQRDGLKRFELEEKALQRNPQAEDLAQDEFLKKLILGLLIALPGSIFFRK